MKEVLKFISVLESMKNHEQLVKLCPFLCICGFSDEEVKEIAKQYSDLINESKLFPLGYRRYYTEAKLMKHATHQECLKVFQKVYDSQRTSNRFYGTVLFDLTDWKERTGNEVASEALVGFIVENASNLRAIINLPNAYKGDLLPLLSDEVRVHIIRKEHIISGQLQTMHNELSGYGFKLGAGEMCTLEKCLRAFCKNEAVSDDALKMMAGEIAIDKLLGQFQSDREVLEQYLEKLPFRGLEGMSKKRIGF